MSTRTILSKVCFALVVLIGLLTLLGWVALTVDVVLLSLVLLALGLLVA